MSQKVNWETDFERALTRAASEDKLILIEFFDPTCDGCQALERVTFPEPAVAGTINNSYVPLQINTKESAAKPIVERYRQVWTPDVRVLDADGFEYYRWNGFLPPFEFLPQLLVAEAHARLRQKNVKAAAEIYNDVIERFPTSCAAPEAAYFAAVANYRASEDSADLMKGWEKLRSRFPGSDWRLKQTMIEDSE